MEKTNKQTEGRVARVILFGPESTGKSTLAKKLASHYGSTWVPEYLRDFTIDKYSRGLELE